METKKRISIMDILSKATVIIEALKTITRLFKRKEDDGK
jgi:hypothetical protein